MKEPRHWWVILSSEDSRIYYSSHPNHYRPGPGWIKVREVIDDENSTTEKNEYDV